MGKVTPPLLKLLDRAIPSDQTHQIHPALHTPVGGNALRGRSQGARPGCTPATPVRAASISCPLRSSAWGYQRKRISRASGHIWWYFGTCLRFLDVDPSMAPHDLGTCGASVSSVRASSRRSLRGTVGDAPTSPSPSPPTSVTTPNDENQDCENEAAGQRRRNRALKLRQTRNRNAARPPQGYMSADESEDEEEDVKPDLSSLCGEPIAPGTDKQAWKKQQRMIRNRESAALSRKRKRDRIEFLEQQVANLLDENRSLKHRLAKYEASPQQARYKYARQTAASAAPRPGESVDGDGLKHNGPMAKPNAAGRERQGGLVGVSYDGRNNHNGHGQGNGKPDSCSPFSYAARLALAPDMAPAAAVLPRPLVRPTLRAVKVEMSSSSSSASSDDDDDDKTASAAVVLDGYSSSSTLDDLSSATERQDCSCFVKEARTLQQQQQQQMVPFDRDDDDACDNLLLDILSGDGQGQDGHDGFFSLLADDMVVDPSCSGSQTAPEPLQGLNCFVKEEAGF
eukprot:jgi/Undpi1/2021/HiC_scaffold_12.g05407.m1